jgi:hypothetical protein
MFREACPDWNTSCDLLVAEDDVVVEHFTASGTFSGSLMGGPVKPSACPASTSFGCKTAKSSSAGGVWMSWAFCPNWVCHLSRDSHQIRVASLGCVLKRSTQQRWRVPEMVSPNRVSVEALC